MRLTRIYRAKTGGTYTRVRSAWRGLHLRLAQTRSKRRPRRSPRETRAAIAPVGSSSLAWKLGAGGVAGLPAGSPLVGGPGFGVRLFPELLALLILSLLFARSWRSAFLLLTVHGFQLPAGAEPRASLPNNRISHLSADYCLSLVDGLRLCQAESVRDWTRKGASYRGSRSRWQRDPGPGPQTPAGI